MRRSRGRYGPGSPEAGMSISAAGRQAHGQGCRTRALVDSVAPFGASLDRRGHRCVAELKKKWPFQQTSTNQVQSRQSERIIFSAGPRRENVSTAIGLRESVRIAIIGWTPCRPRRDDIPYAAPCCVGDRPCANYRRKPACTFMRARCPGDRDEDPYRRARPRFWQSSRPCFWHALDSSVLVSGIPSGRNRTETLFSSPRKTPKRKSPSPANLEIKQRGSIMCHHQHLYRGATICSHALRKALWLQAGA